MAHAKTCKDMIENYDPETDTMYVSFGTGEPSYAEELDDVLVLEMGVFSRLPTGFRIINFSKHKVAGVTVSVEIKKKLDNTIKREEHEVIQNFRERVQQLEQGVNAALAP